MRSAVEHILPACALRNLLNLTMIMPTNLATLQVVCLPHRDGGSVLEEVRLVGGHGDDGDAEVDPQHVDDAEAEEGQAGVQFDRHFGT